MFKTCFGDDGMSALADGIAEARSDIDGVALKICGTIGIPVSNPDDWQDRTYEPVPIELSMTIRAHEARRIAAILVSAADEANRICDRAAGQYART